MQFLSGPTVCCSAVILHSLLMKHYAKLKEKPFFPKLVKYMSSGPVVPMVKFWCFHYCIFEIAMSGAWQTEI